MSLAHLRQILQVLQLGMWMTVGGRVPLLLLSQMKLTTLGSGDHEEDPRLACHKVLVSSFVTVRIIGSKTTLVCEGTLPDLGMANVRLLFSALPRWWWMTRKGEAQISPRMEL
jgi:hypothetical protein